MYLHKGVVNILRAKTVADGQHSGSVSTFLVALDIIIVTDESCTTRGMRMVFTTTCTSNALFAQFFPSLLEIAS